MFWEGEKKIDLKGRIRWVEDRGFQREGCSSLREKERKREREKERKREREKERKRKREREKEKEKKKRNRKFQRLGAGHTLERQWLLGGVSHCYFFSSTEKAIGGIERR